MAGVTTPPWSHPNSLHMPFIVKDWSLPVHLAMADPPPPAPTEFTIAKTGSGWVSGTMEVF